MAPIPKRLLTQTAIVRIPVDGGYGGECEDPVTIGHVRFEASAKRAQNDYELQVPVKGTLFIDARNSDGARELPVGTRVTIDGEASEATVLECDAILDDGGRVHHWEVTL